MPELKQALDVWTKQAHATMKQLSDDLSSQAHTIKTQVITEVTNTVLKTGNLTETVSGVLNINGGTGSVVGDGTSIQVKQASATQDGFLSKFDWNVFNTRSGSVTTGNLTESTSAVLTITGGTNAVVGSGTTVQVKQAGTSQSGFLSSTDWNTFNGKAAAFTKGNLTEAVSSVLTITGGTAAIIGSGLTIQVTKADATHSGYLSFTDWNIFNNKGGFPITNSIVLLNVTSSLGPITITSVAGLYRTSVLAVSITGAGIDDSSLEVGTTADDSGTPQSQGIGPYSNSNVGSGGEFVSVFSVEAGGSLYYTFSAGHGGTSNLYILVEKIA